jgi:hypothetical protein
MEIGQVLLIVLYAWLLTAVGVYLWRAYRRVVHHETRQDRQQRRVTQRPTGAAPGTDPVPTDRPALSTSADRPSEASDEPAAAGQTRDSGADRQAPPTDGDPWRAEGSATVPPGTGTRPEPDEVGRSTVAEAVRGIELPCDLVPLIEGTRLDPHRAVFSTSGHEPRDISAALTRTFEDLGYATETINELETRAVRADATVRVRVRPGGGDTAPSGGGAPATDRRGIVVEIST